MCSLNERLFPYLLQSQLKAAKQTHFSIINFPYHHQIANEKRLTNILPSSVENIIN